MDEVHRAAAEAAAGHAGTIDAGDGEGRIDQIVELRTAHLVVVLQRAVRLDEELAEAFEIAGLRGGVELLHAPTFENDVAGAGQGDFGHLRGCTFQLGEGDVAQGLLAREIGSGGGAFGDALAVGRGAELVLDHRVDGDYLNAVGDRHELVRERAAVEQNGVVGLAEHGRVLVHDAAGHADEVTLGALAEAGDQEFVERPAGEESKSSGDFERGRGTQSAAGGHGGIDRQLG